MPNYFAVSAAESAKHFNSGNLSKKRVSFFQGVSKDISGMKWVNTKTFNSFFPDPVGRSIFNVKAFLTQCFVEKVIAVQALIKSFEIITKKSKRTSFLIFI